MGDVEVKDCERCGKAGGVIRLGSVLEECDNCGDVESSGDLLPSLRSLRDAAPRDTAERDTLTRAVTEIQRLRARDAEHDAKALRMLADAGDPVARVIVNAPVVDEPRDPSEPEIDPTQPVDGVPHVDILQTLLEHAEAEHDALADSVRSLIGSLPRCLTCHREDFGRPSTKGTNGHVESDCPGNASGSCDEHAYTEDVDNLGPFDTDVPWAQPLRELMVRLGMHENGGPR